MEEEQSVPAAIVDCFRAYSEHASKEVERVRRNLMGLSADDQNSLVWKPEEQVKGMEQAVAANVAFLSEFQKFCEPLVADAATFAEFGAQKPVPPSGSQALQNLLQMLVREWSAEGLSERKECFERLLSALDGHLAAALKEGSASPKVLVPGAQLSRLAYEVVCKGYACEASECRALPFLAGEFIRQKCAGKELHRLQPYALQTCNRFNMKDHLRPTPIPEVDLEAGKLGKARFGNFIQLYDTAAARGSCDALLTAFCLDASTNVFRFVRTAAHVVREGGLWANFGPLAYKSEHDDGHGLELSWEELRYAISHFFTVQEEQFVDALHAANAESMMQMQYSCIYFKAVRNGSPAKGIGAA